MLASRIANELSEGYGISVSVLDIYTNSTLGALLDFLDGQGKSSGAPGGRQRGRRALPQAPGQGAPEIAIVGLAGRFPGAVDADAFWQNIVKGAVSMTTFSKEYLMSKGVPEVALAHKDFVPGAYMINDADKFDHQFFGINRNEAAHMDPQHRVFIETTWAALDNAALPPRSGLSDTVVGVFAAAGIDGGPAATLSTTWMVSR
ncbi:unnamed protein product [Prorocentrum cordatum]|uniref:Ketosynthase family 3 (KS3) domain-containing protein n=1 Tax=Prorocentrum cordatum TaxID=2364126 RepID=A0ABN9XCL2_9DINO|nr:unnamed protein product [Polarella glacialis]